MKNALLVLIAVVLAAAVAEGLVRAVGLGPRDVRVNRFFAPGRETTWSDPDAELGWINKPGTARSLEGDGALMTFWSDSRRAVRPDPAPPPSAARAVMVIGGSNAQAYGVADADSFAYRLQQRFPDVWFENFGTGGYGTVQATMLAERALRTVYAARKPDLILLGFDDSHAVRNVADREWIFSITDPQGRYIAPPHFRLQGDTLAFYPFRTIAPWPLERRSAAVTLLHGALLRTIAYDTASQAIPVTRRMIGRLAALARANGAAFAVAVLEDRSGTAAQMLPDDGFPRVDCSGPGRADPAAYLIGGNGHPNARLHAAFADCIGAWLEREVFPAMPPARPRAAP
jgi:hypothetical protein